MVIGIDDEARILQGCDQFRIPPAVLAHTVGDLDSASRRAGALPPAARNSQAVLAGELEIVAQILRRIHGIKTLGSCLIPSRAHSASNTAIMNSLLPPEVGRPN